MRKKNESEGMSERRRAILRYIPAEMRAEIFEKSYGKDAKRQMLVHSIAGITLSVSMVLAVAIWLGYEPFLYGYLYGLGVTYAIVIGVAYKYAGRLWREPTDEELEELRD